MSKTDKSKALDAAIASIEKQHGKGVIFQMGEVPVLDPSNFISSGSLRLDRALGGHGYPKGRIVEIYGPESSGKTTLMLHAAAECQQAGGTVAFVDVEHALDPTYAKALGVDMGALYISQPGSAEQALEVVDTLVASAAVDMIVVDSVAALVPEAEIKGEMGDSHVGLQARLMGQALRKLTRPVSHNNVLLVFINQIRMKIGVMFGSPETTSGGNALKFYASVRLDIRRIGALKAGDAIIGNKTRVKIKKNKIAPPFKEAEFDIVYGKGIDYPTEILDEAVDAEIVNKAGAWYSYDGERIGQGRANTGIYLEAHPAMLQEIRAKLKS